MSVLGVQNLLIILLLIILVICDLTHFRESEGSFEFGNYLREADDLHSVTQHFCGATRIVSAILGHSKGEWIVLGVLLIRF